MQKVKLRPVSQFPANNSIRRLRWLRKRAGPELKPGLQFPVTLYI